MRNASQEHERVVGFPPYFRSTVSEFFAEPEPEIKTSLTYTTATFHSVEKSALAQGLSAPHHHSLAPSSITISSIPQTTEQLVTSHLRLSIATEISIDS